MANAFTVTASQLRKAATELTNLNGDYRGKIEALSGTEMELRSMWEGEANKAFQNAFQRDVAQFENFYMVIARYIEALQNAATQYEQAEKEATSIAGTRTYK